LPIFAPQLINLLIQKKIAWLSALLLCISLLTAQVNVAVVFDRQNIETGDTFTMRVLVTGTNAKPDRIDLSAWSAVLPTENVLRRSAWTHTADKWVSEYTLLIFDAFEGELPPLGVLSLSGEKALSNPVAIKVTSTPSPDDLEKMEPVRDIRYEPLLWTDYALLLGILVALYTVYLFLIRKKKKPPVQIQALVAVAAPVVPPHIIALQKLKKLEQAKPWKSGDIKGYYADLSSILKEYLENKYHILALESTTREVEILLKKIPLQEGRTMALLTVLRQTDLAKYAQALDPGKPHEQFLLKAEEFVHKTAEETI
jgi:hypothetical protein